MNQTANITLDPRSTKLNRLFFSRLVAVTKPYWARKRATWSWLALGFLLLLMPVYSILGAYSAKILGDQTNALVAKQADLFWKLLLIFTAAAALRSLLFCAQIYISGKLNLHWRQWLTAFFVDRYLTHRTYYEITVDQSIDNPDQRIQGELAPFCQTMSVLPQQLLGSLVDMGVQAGILWLISPTMFWSVVVFAAIKTACMLWVFKPTIKQNYEITVAEANLRYGLLHVRDNAENIAFYRGEHAENRQIRDRLATTVKKNLISVVYNVWISFVGFGFSNLWAVLPMLFLAPLYFGGGIEYGTIVQGTYAAGLILSGLSVLMNFIPALSYLAPHVTRLAEIQEKFEHLSRERVTTSEMPRIRLVTGAQVALQQVSLQTPGGELQLVQNLSLTVGARENLVIIGQTGVGKSSLLRAMAGLWTRGEGRITIPPQEEVLFLPQRPYMILSNLRAQLHYPAQSTKLTDGELQAVLERVELPNLAEKHGGFDAEKDWGRVLSLGEQQRIGFARVLVTRPRYVFLDEATGALDVETEHKVYGLLACSSATYISVGHRPTILNYHKTALRLKPGGSWELLPARLVTFPDFTSGSIRTV